MSQNFKTEQKWLTNPESFDAASITIHRSELIPGGNGARIGYSDDFPGKQFLFIPSEVNGDNESDDDLGLA